MHQGSNTCMQQLLVAYQPPTMKRWFLILVTIPLVLVHGLPFYYKDRYHTKTDRKVSPAFNLNEARMMGLDTGNSAADFEAGMWLMALIGTLAAAVPVAFLNPSLGFKKRSISQDDSIMDKVVNAIEKFKVNPF